MLHPGVLPLVLSLFFSVCASYYSVPGILMSSLGSRGSHEGFSSSRTRYVFL